MFFLCKFSICRLHKYIAPGYCGNLNFHWARVRFGPVPLAIFGNGSIVSSPAAVYFTVLSQTPRRPSYFQSSTIALDTGLLLKAKMSIRDLTCTTELESQSNMDPSDILD